MLADKPLILSRQMINGLDFSEWIGLPDEQIKISATSNLIFNGSLLVDEGIGYAVTLDKLINCTGDSNLIFRPLYPHRPAQMYLVWKKYQIFSKAAELVLKKFRDVSESCNL